METCLEILKCVGFFSLVLVIFGVVRRYSSETMVNGWMDSEKAADLAPTIFKPTAKEEQKSESTEA